MTSTKGQISSQRGHGRPDMFTDEHFLIARGDEGWQAAAQGVSGERKREVKEFQTTVLNLFAKVGSQCHPAALSFRCLSKEPKSLVFCRSNFEKT